MVGLLYIPVLHNGYVEFFNRHKHISTLYLLDEYFTDQFPELKREIRKIDLKTIKKILESLEFFKKVEILTINNINKLKDETIITSNEVEIKEILKRYIPTAKIIYDEIFLRWDAKSVNKTNKVEADTNITKDRFSKEIIKLIEKEAEFSSDWFRRVGAAIIKNKKLLITGHNKRKPSRQAPYSEDDPRNFIQAGIDTHLRNVLHAEQDVICYAAKHGISINGADIYVTTFPCPDCASLIASCGIKRCYFSGGYSSIDGERVLKDTGIEIIKVI